MLSKIREYLWATEKKKLAGIIAMGAIVLALPLIVIVSQQQQEIRQRASELVSPLPIPTVAGFGKAIVGCAVNERPTSELSVNSLGSPERFTIDGWFKLNRFNSSGIGYILYREPV